MHERSALFKFCPEMEHFIARIPFRKVQDNNIIRNDLHIKPTYRPPLNIREYTDNDLYGEIHTVYRRSIKYLMWVQNWVINLV